MRCSPYVWIFIFTAILGLNGADNTSTVNCSSVCLDALSAQAIKLSKECNDVADSKRAALLAEGQSEIASAVGSAQARLMKCGLNSDPLLFFHCLQGTMDEARETLDEMVKKSFNLIAQHAVELSDIDKEETDCLEAVVRKSKLEADQAFVDYKECLSTGSDCCCSDLTTSPSSTPSSISTSFTSAVSSTPSRSSSSFPSSLASASSTSSTTTAQPTKEESSMVAPESEMGIHRRLTDGSETFVAVTIASVGLVIILLIVTYLYRKRATRSRFQLKT